MFLLPKTSASMNLLQDHTETYVPLNKTPIANAVNAGDNTIGHGGIGDGYGGHVVPNPVPDTIPVPNVVTGPPTNPTASTVNILSLLPLPLLQPLLLALSLL